MPTFRTKDEWDRRRGSPDTEHCGAGRPVAQRTLPRRAGGSLGPHRPRHLPTHRRVDRRLGSGRGRHAPPRRYDLPGFRTRAPRPD
nr:hypothetical protein [Mycobacterium canetti]